MHVNQNTFIPHANTCLNGKLQGKYIYCAGRSFLRTPQTNFPYLILLLCLFQQSLQLKACTSGLIGGRRFASSWVLPLTRTGNTKLCIA